MPNTMNSRSANLGVGAGARDFSSGSESRRSQRQRAARRLSTIEHLADHDRDLIGECGQRGGGEIRCAASVRGERSGTVLGLRARRRDLQRLRWRRAAGRPPHPAPASAAIEPSPHTARRIRDKDQSIRTEYAARLPFGDQRSTVSLLTSTDCGGMMKTAAGHPSSVSLAIASPMNISFFGLAARAPGMS
jgi:hypothetical protein